MISVTEIFFGFWGSFHGSVIRSCLTRHTEQIKAAIGVTAVDREITIPS